jgi:hypothetical protein
MGRRQLTEFIPFLLLFNKIRGPNYAIARRLFIVGCHKVNNDESLRILPADKLQMWTFSDLRFSSNIGYPLKV